MGNIFGHVQQHRPRPAAGRYRESAANMLRNATHDLDPNDLFDNRPKNLDLTGFLGHVFPGVLAVGIARDDDHGNAGVETLHDAGDEVGRTWAKRGIGDARAIGHFGIGVGGKRSAALIIDQIVLQTERTTRFVKRQQLKAAHAEHRTDLVQAQHFSQGMAAGHLLRRIRLLRLLHVTPFSLARFGPVQFSISAGWPPANCFARAATIVSTSSRQLIPTVPP